MDPVTPTATTLRDTVKSSASSPQRRCTSEGSRLETGPLSVSKNTAVSVCPSLCGLPEELIEQIAASFSAKSTSLLDLSSTCKRLRRITYDLVLARFFTDRTFLFADKASLETLLFISQHFTFARALKTIYLSFATLYEAAEAVNEDLTCCHDKCESVKIITEPLRNIDNHLHRVHKRLLKEERQFRHKAVDVHMLHTILSNFKAIGRFPAIIVGGHGFLSEQYQERAWGYKRLTRMLGPPSVPCLGVDISDQTPFYLLYQSIRSIQYRLSHLELGHAAFGVPLSLFEPFKDNAAFSYLRTLHLAIEPTWKEMQAVEEGRGEEINTLLSNFRSFLRECYNLQGLALVRTNYNQGRSTSALIFSSVILSTKRDSLKTPALTKIESLSLEGFAFTFKDLQDFVKVTRASLVYLAVTLQQWTVPEPTAAARQLRLVHGGELELHGPMFGDIDQGSDGLFD